MFMGVKPQRSDHYGVWVEFFLRYHLSETRIASEYKHQMPTLMSDTQNLGPFAP